MTTVAIVHWFRNEEIGLAIGAALERLGYATAAFLPDETIPACDVVFSYAPYGRFLQITNQLSKMPSTRRPLLIHWNTEDQPDPMIPRRVRNLMADLRSRIDRLNDSDHPLAQTVAQNPIFNRVNRKFTRFRYLGEYRYAYQKGLLDVFVEWSTIYATNDRTIGLPAAYIPWGVPDGWYADLGLTRDIDVLWMGNPRTGRRRRLLRELVSRLRAAGAKVYVADDVERPYIFGRQRTEILNRSKITLSLLPLRHGSVLPHRFCTAAANKSLVVSELELPHCPEIEAGRHYVAAAPDRFAARVMHYLEQDCEREHITQQAHELLVTQLRLSKSVERIMQLVEKRREEYTS